jgi:putative effector of murein hydrolase
MTSFRLWVYLQTTPLFWLTATLGAFLIADGLAKAARRHPIVNPVAIAIALLGALLALTGTDYQTYFNGAQFVHFLLGPATVALAVPLYRNRELVRRDLLPMAARSSSARLSRSHPRSSSRNRLARRARCWSRWRRSR